MVTCTIGKSDSDKIKIIKLGTIIALNLGSKQMAGKN